MNVHGLSKSRIIAWKQCPKRLWLQVHRQDLTEASDAIESAFQIGFEVGDVARSLYPTGVMIDDGDGLARALAQTRRVLATHPENPIFEATFQHDGMLVRTDLMVPTAAGYRLVEIKSTASVKHHHMADCAVQAWVVRHNGIALAAIELAHVDTGFVFQGDGNYEGMFRHADLSAAIEPWITQVPDWIRGARATLSGPEPVIEPGEHCDEPHACPYKSYCSRHGLPAFEPEYPLDVLYRMNAKTRSALRAAGIDDARLVPTDMLSEIQTRIQRVSRTGTFELSSDASKPFAVFGYPRYYLDFETVNLAVPRWAQTRPYVTQVPFQWSCHVETSRHVLRHRMFLDMSGADPRRQFAMQMIDTLKDDGPVFVYCESFEKGRMAELAVLYPDLAIALAAISSRIVDLLPITRTHYCHPAMKGSWSLKAVLPTIAADLRHDLLEVGDGGEAQTAFRTILHPDTPAPRKAALASALRQYCTLDTLAMVRLAWFLQGDAP